MKIWKCFYGIGSERIGTATGARDSFENGIGKNTWQYRTIGVCGLRS